VKASAQFNSESQTDDMKDAVMTVEYADDDDNRQTDQLTASRTGNCE